MLSIKQGRIKYYFWSFGMTRPGVEPSSSWPSMNSLPTITYTYIYIYIVCVCMCVKYTNMKTRGIQNMICFTFLRHSFFFILNDHPENAKRFVSNLCYVNIVQNIFQSVTFFFSFSCCLFFFFFRKSLWLFHFRFCG